MNISEGNENLMEKIIAKKSYIDVYFNLIILIIITPLLLMFYIHGEYFGLILYILWGLLILYYIFKCLIAPRNIIIQRDNNLLIYPNSSKEKTILITNIASSDDKNTNRFASIFIKIKSEQEEVLMVNYVKDRKKVVEKINILVKEYNNL